MQAPCHASHPQFQTGFHAWVCPVCRHRLVTDNFAADADPGCEQLHSDDILVCTNPQCAFSGFGNVVAKFVATRGANTVCPACRGRPADGPPPCQRCSGRGYVPKTASVLKRGAAATA